MCWKYYLQWKIVHVRHQTISQRCQVDRRGETNLNGFVDFGGGGGRHTGNQCTRNSALLFSPLDGPAPIRVFFDKSRWCVAIVHAGESNSIHQLCHVLVPEFWPGMSLCGASILETNSAEGQFLQNASRAVGNWAFSYALGNQQMYFGLYGHFL